MFTFTKPGVPVDALGTTYFVVYKIINQSNLQSKIHQTYNETISQFCFFFLFNVNLISYATKKKESVKPCQTMFIDNFCIVQNVLTPAANPRLTHSKPRSTAFMAFVCSFTKKSKLCYCCVVCCCVVWLADFWKFEICCFWIEALLLFYKNYPTDIITFANSDDTFE